LIAVLPHPLNVPSLEVVQKRRKASHIIARVADELCLKLSQRAAIPCDSASKPGAGDCSGQCPCIIPREQVD
jgi:hypothetical protein